MKISDKIAESTQIKKKPARKKEVGCGANGDTCYNKKNFGYKIKPG
jgi:hypothetical protein